MSASTITLTDLLPAVFADERERHTSSEVWLTSLRFDRGGRYLVQAESGKGKTSLCAFISGLRTDYNGRIALDGRDYATFLPEERIALRRDTFACLPQDLKLFPSLTALENIRLKNSLTGYKTDAQILQMLEALEMDELKDRPAGKLSIGQQQRVAIVRTLCQPYDLLILDEPVSHLDERSNRTVASLIDSEISANGTGVIITSVGNHLLLDGCDKIQL